MKYIVTQVAQPKKNKVPQMQGAGVKKVSDAMAVYIKNAIVSLASAKMWNPDAVCILNCNFEVPEELRQVAERAKIQLLQVPYGKYKSNEAFSWAITQYKYDSMDFMVNEVMKDDDVLILLDTDTVCVQKLDDIFEEAEKGLILYPISHGYRHERRHSMIRNFQKLYGEDCDNLVHYGGEFFAGNRQALGELLQSCMEVIEKARQREDLEPWDDEHILSIAVERQLKQKVYPALEYIYRYWTNQFYLVSTNYFYDPVRIWHLPSEKNYGMMVLYEYFCRHQKFPTIEKMAAIMGFPGHHYKIWNPWRWKMRIRNKLKACK